MSWRTLQDWVSRRFRRSKPAAEEPLVATPEAPMLAPLASIEEMQRRINEYLARLENESVIGQKRLSVARSFFMRGFLILRREPRLLDEALRQTQSDS